MNREIPLVITMNWLHRSYYNHYQFHAEEKDVLLDGNFNDLITGIFSLYIIRKDEPFYGRGAEKAYKYLRAMCSTRKVEENLIFRDFLQVCIDDPSGRFSNFASLDDAVSDFSGLTKRVNLSKSREGLRAYDLFEFHTELIEGGG